MRTSNILLYMQISVWLWTVQFLPPRPPPQHPIPNNLNLGENESSPLNRSCDMLGFMKVSVIFFPLPFSTNASFLLFPNQGQPSNSSQKDCSDRRGWEGLHIPWVSHIAAVGPGFACPMVLELESKFWHWPQRLTTSRRSTSDSRREVVNIKRQCSQPHGVLSQAKQKELAPHIPRESGSSITVQAEATFTYVAWDGQRRPPTAMATAAIPLPSLDKISHPHRIYSCFKPSLIP